MEIKSQNDIIAFKVKGEPPIGFHARNLEVAEISEELWNDFGTPDMQVTLNDWNDEISPVARTISLDFQIRSLTINVTQICNLKCTYCAAGGDGSYGEPQLRISVEKTIPQLKFFLERLPPQSNFKIIFLGGEPLLYPEGIRALSEYVKIVSQHQNINPEFAIVTNGTLFSDDNISLLKNIKCNVTISIDGPASINDQVRPLKNNQGSTGLVVQGLNRLFKQRHELGLITLHGIFNDQNMNIIDAFEFYKTFPADKFEFTLDVKNSKIETSLEFTRQIDRLAANIYALGGEQALRRIAFFDNIFSALDSQIRSENYCGAGKSFLVVDANNRIFTCPWDVGNKNETVGENQYVNKTNLEKYKDPLVQINRCQDCWARYLCGGGCMYIHKNDTGSKNLKSPQFCQRMKSMLLTCLFYYKKSREI